MHENSDGAETKSDLQTGLPLIINMGEMGYSNISAVSMNISIQFQ